MRNIRLTLAYDGTAYVGWQIQPNGISVQAAVEAGIRQFTGTEVSLIAAGRTDAGVHALGQVANFHTPSEIPCQGFRAGLQAFLPPDIFVLDAEEVDLAFHATYAAKRKRYRYVIWNGRARHPFLRNDAYEFHAPLDAAAMHQAAQIIVGRHDFRAFESQHPNTATSVRTVFEATVARMAGWSAWQPHAVRAPGEQPRGEQSPGEFLAFDIVADGFLYNMVRALAGTLIRVGERKWGVDDIRRILQAGDRKQAGPTAPACGLYLVRVEYGESADPAADMPYGSSSQEAQP